MGKRKFLLLGKLDWTPHRRAPWRMGVAALASVSLAARHHGSVMSMSCTRTAVAIDRIALGGHLRRRRGPRPGAFLHPLHRGLNRCAEG